MNLKIITSSKGTKLGNNYLGGGIYLTKPNATIKNCDFTTTTTNTIFGGGIGIRIAEADTTGGTIKITGCTFESKGDATNNTTAGPGGAIDVHFSGDHVQEQHSELRWRYILL